MLDYNSFNSRTRKGCDEIGSSQRSNREFQFTHPQGVRLKEICKFYSLKVSIHAPARGAIFRLQTKGGEELFQFTHPQGVRCVRDAGYNTAIVSIHAPARGAIKTRLYFSAKKCFNSRTRKGCDFLGFCLLRIFQFQFTHPQGVRLNF